MGLRRCVLAPLVASPPTPHLALNIRRQGHLTVGQRAVKRMSGLPAEEEEEQLLIARRLELFTATVPQLAVPRRVVLRAQHRCRAVQGREPVANGGVVEAAVA